MAKVNHAGSRSGGEGKGLDRSAGCQPGTGLLLCRLSQGTPAALASHPQLLSLPIFQKL